MSDSLRQRRLLHEAEALELLLEENPDALQRGSWLSVGQSEQVTLHLPNTPSFQQSQSGLRLVTEHSANVIFPRFFPAVPIEIYLANPVFHPNVDPQSGFVCLWSRFSAGDTIIEAIRRLQRILVWDMLSLEAVHTMQPEAAHWYSDPRRVQQLPLAAKLIREPVGWRAEREARDEPAGHNRQRLFLPDDPTPS